LKSKEAIFPFEDRLRRLPGDQGGSVLLLTGLMAFVIAIATLIALDTSQAIYSRIIAQNAVDAAAETGALWQARGLNMLQNLNNDHYLFNVGVWDIESAAMGYCTGSIGAIADMWSTCADPFTFEACPGAIENAESHCSACSFAITCNNTQTSYASLCQAWQEAIAVAIPILADAYASDAAQDAGADDINTVFAQYPGGDLLEAKTLEDPLTYARTISPTSTFLNQQMTSGSYFPWNWVLFGVPAIVVKAGFAADYTANAAACEADGLGSYDPSWSDPDKWGWSDSYSRGVPGNMQWIAGKKNQSELANLGALRWMNGGSPPADVQYSFLNQQNLAMYTGSALNSSSLMIPAFIAVAGSQAEPPLNSNHVQAEGKDVWDSAIPEIDLIARDLPAADSAPKLTTANDPFLGTTGSDTNIFH